ncbi:TatD family hydrolase [Zooshikella harenae]|uniref:TatD family hydrolase n=1 Tax=Zooshikella harenae TaxID=2827238 RepID=A0ABS5ZB03_9GAMM|nr:TatD family hydrolase [Zooshikella harenae]MBU2711246.1 TatD family hydrolase [Zooshikella harenae]
MYFDSHCHLNFEAFDQDRTELLEQCAEQQVTNIFIPTITQANWAKLLGLLRLIPGQHTGVDCVGGLGLHPYFLAQHMEQHLLELDSLLAQQHPGIVAVGEIGLDYMLKELDVDCQVHYFLEQVKLADKHNLPVVLHARKSFDQLTKILRDYPVTKKGIVHAFAGSSQQAYRLIEMGYKLGFGGAVTFDRATKLRTLVKELPLESLVLETDAPNMPPDFAREERNSPLNLPKIASVIADIRGIAKEHLAEICAQNSKEVFGLL